MTGEDEDHINQSQDYGVGSTTFIEKGKTALDCNQLYNL